MAWGYTRKIFGVCGNFRFSFIDLTDVKATRSLIRPAGLNSVKFISTVNTTDTADVFAGVTLAWTGTCDSDVENEVADAGEVFDTRMNGCMISNTTDTVGVANDSLVANIKRHDNTSLYTFHAGAAFDLCPDGDETYTVYDERVVQVVAGTANDDGSLLVIGD